MPSESDHPKSSGADARTEQLHRADGGGAPIDNMGEGYGNGHDPDSGERCLLRLFATGSLQPGFTVTTLPAATVGVYGAITDYLNFVFPFTACGRDVAGVVRAVSALLGTKSSPAVERPGKYRYEKAVKLGDTTALILFGGNNDTCMVSLTGESCALVQDWPGMVALGRDHWRGHITRWDGAIDDYAGDHTVDDALSMWREGKFGKGGNGPAMRQDGNWAEPDGRGRTIYFGGHAGGKSATVYEKGMQLGSKSHPWTRWEISYGNSNREVPWEALLNPGGYAVGAYPKALCWAGYPASHVKTIQKQEQIGFDALMEHCARSYGPLLRIAVEVLGTPEKVLQRLVRPGTPKRLRHPFIDKPQEWIE